MRESVTYQAILREGREEGRQEGRAEEARRLLLRLGARKLGPPGAAIVTRLEAIEDLSTLERMTDQILTATNWHAVVEEADAI